MGKEGEGEGKEPLVERVVKREDWCDQQFQWEMMSLKNEDPIKMVTSDWPCMSPGPGFCAYRLVMAVSTTVLTALNGWAELRRYHQPWPWFSYATNWGVLAMNGVLWNLAFYVLVFTLDKGKLIQGQTMPCCLSVSWALYSAMASSAFVITGCYWVYLFGIDPSPIFQVPESYAKHSLNSIIIFVDVMVSGIPIRLVHFVFPVLFAVLYAFFSYLWYLFDAPLLGHQTSIYSVLDWNEPGIAIAFICLNITFLVLAQCVLFSLYKLRVCLQNTCFTNSSKGEEYEEIQGGSKGK